MPCGHDGSEVTLGASCLRPVEKSTLPFSEPWLGEEGQRPAGEDTQRDQGSPFHPSPGSHPLLFPGATPPTLHPGSLLNTEHFSGDGRIGVTSLYRTVLCTVDCTWSWNTASTQHRVLSIYSRSQHPANIHWGPTMCQAPIVGTRLAIRDRRGRIPL